MLLLTAVSKGRVGWQGGLVVVFRVVGELGMVGMARGDGGKTSGMTVVTGQTCEPRHVCSVHCE